MTNITDKVFGEMNYDFAWEKTVEKKIFGKERVCRIVAAAFPGEEINDYQRNAYLDYKTNEKRYFDMIPSALLNYYIDNFESISEMVNVPEKMDKDHINKQSIVRIVKLKTLYFDRKGRCGWLCDCIWDQDNGICILLKPSGVEVTSQDVLI